MKKIILAGLLALTQVAHADSKVKVFVDLPLFGAPVYVQPQRQYVAPVVTYNNGYYNNDSYYSTYTTTYNTNPYYNSGYVAPVIVYDNYRNNYYDNRHNYRDYRDNRNNENRYEHHRRDNDRYNDYHHR